MSDFVHLRVKSDYSLLESIIKAKDIIKLAKDEEMSAVGITDINSLSGCLEFCNEAAKNKIQPIIGLDLQFQIFLPNEKEYKNTNALLIAQSEIGYQNLIKLNKLYFERQLENKNIIFDQDFTEESIKDLIMLSGFENGILTVFKNDNLEPLLEKIKILFPNDRFYIEIQRNGQNRETEDFLLKIAYDHNIPIVATNNVLFHKKEYFDAHDALICIKDGTYVSAVERRRFSDSHYFKSKQEMIDLFYDLPEAIENTIHIKKRCYFKVENRPPTLPKFNDDEDSELVNQAIEGLKNKNNQGLIPNFPEYEERLNFELETIKNMGFAGYFLIVADFINWSKKNDIPVGPGRGSAAGSLVAWCMGITDVDPIRFGLLFERFLNPERVSMPDIDVDFCQEKRDLVINYIQNKYGIDNVAHIITFGALQAKAVVRDVARVLTIPYFEADAICKMIPVNPANPITLAQAIDLDPQLQQKAEENDVIKKLLALGLQLEGVLRNQSTHAAGVVISDKPLHEIIPVCRDLSNSALVSQFHMKSLENAGLVKFDFLGLTTLTLLDKVCKSLFERHKIVIDFIKMELNDVKTYQMLAKGDAIGVFQLESGIMRDGLKKIRSDCFEDIVALTSLNRPGPMENMPDYVGRKFGKKEIDYLHPKLEKLLKETFGIIVYQEQVMEIAKILGGYSLGAADILRRAMGKKIKEEMDAQKEIFVSGAIKNDLTRDRAEFIFDLVAKFAGYGFNKSHATAYSLLSYQTAWLKKYYKLEFLTVLMNLEIHDTDKLIILKNDAEQSEIRILPPCINRSQVEFSIEGKNIRYGLAACKNAGKGLAEEIIKNRKENGKFKSIGDFLNRFNTKIINKKFLESMIKSGAFDCFGANRCAMFISVEDMIKYTNNNSANVGQLGLFFGEDIDTFELKKASDWTEHEKMQNEFEAIGFYLTNHPVQYYSTFLSSKNITSSGNLEMIERQQNVFMAGVVTYIRIRSSKKGKFANITLSDLDGLFDLFIYDDELIQQNGDILKEGKFLYCEVRVSTDRETRAKRLSVLSVQNVIMMMKDEKAVFELDVNDDLNFDELKNTLGNENEEGKTNYFLSYFYGDYEVKIRLPRNYDFPEDLNKIKNVDGAKKLRRII
jgi:DNA polymerase-3 subunit alpha